MALVDRLMPGGANRIPGHVFPALLGEWARGAITGAQAQAIVTAQSGVALDAQEQTDAQTIVNTVVTAIPVTGTAVQQADARARRALRINEIEQVINLAGIGSAPYDDPVFVKTRLGI